MPKLSVIMPAYNAEKYIREAIDSILCQTFSDFELIIIDDGSQDNTRDIVLSYTDKRIRYIKNEQNMGVAATLNRGIDLSSGEYIARMDSDDISLPERFEKQVAYMDVHIDVAVCATAIETFFAKEETRVFSTGAEALKVDLLFGCCFAHPSVIMRSSVLKENGYRYDEAFGKMEDYDLWCRISERFALASIPQVLLKYRIHPQQITQNYSHEMERQLRMLKLRQMKRLGIDEKEPGFESFVSYCLGKYCADADFIPMLSDFFEKIKEKNAECGLYDGSILASSFRSIIKGLLGRLPASEALRISERCKVNPVSYIARRTALHFASALKNKIRVTQLRTKLKNKSFTIISNNCYGGFIYQKYGLKYTTPTIGLYILGDDFVKLCGDFQHYISGELEFIPWEGASYYPMLKNETPYPVARLRDIEIYFMHYKNEKEAKEKWERRIKRMDTEHMIFKLSQRERCERCDVEAFLSLPLKNKICFSHSDVPGAVHIPELCGLSGDETPIISRYFDELSYLNNL